MKVAATIFLSLLLFFCGIKAFSQDHLAYDDDHADQKVGGMDRYYAVRISPSENGQILELHFDLSLTGEIGQFEILLFDWTGSSPSTTPVYEYVAMVERSGLYIHRIDPPIQFSGEFIVGFRSLEYGLFLGSDPGSNERGWERSVAEPGWEQSDKSFFIRAVVESDSQKSKKEKANEQERPDHKDDVIVIGTDGTISHIMFLDSNGVVAYEHDLNSDKPLEIPKLVPGPYLLLLYSEGELVSTERVFIR